MRLPRTVVLFLLVGSPFQAIAQEVVQPTVGLEPLPAEVSQGARAVPVARLTLPRGGAERLSYVSSHAECRPSLRNEGAGKVLLLLSYERSGRALGSCSVSVELRGRSETRRVHTVPLVTRGGASTLEVRFTNPDCPARPYVGYFEPSRRLSRGESHEPLSFVTDPRGIPLLGGGWRKTTKPGAFCLGSDMLSSRQRAGSPSEKLLSWVNGARSGSSIFFSSFTFSDKVLRDALCAAARRGVKVEFVIGAESEVGSTLVSECGAVAYPGGAEDEGRLNHAKFFVIEEPRGNRAKIVFQSANVSTSGLTLHHENWSFAEMDRNSDFVQDHICYRDALKKTHFNVAGSNPFAQQVERCRARTGSGRDDGIEAFLIPGRRGSKSEGDVLNGELLKHLASSSSLDIAAHHLLSTSRGRPNASNDLISAIRARLERDRRFRVRIVMDHEIHWVGSAGRVDREGTFPYDHYPAAARLRGEAEDRGANFARHEYELLRKLRDAGAQVRFVETNFLGSRFQHNKFLIFRKSNGKAILFTGAGNFSSSAFHRNGETFYLIRDSRLVDAWEFQYDYMWNTLATRPGGLPVTWAAQVEGATEWDTWKQAIEAPKVAGAIRTE